MNDTSARGIRPRPRRLGRASHGQASDNRSWARPGVALLAVLAMVVTGCNGDDTVADPTTAAPTGDGPTATAMDTGDEATPTPGGTTTAAPDDGPTPTPMATEGATTPANGVMGGDLPGEEFTLFWQDGDVLGVVGVAHDDVLNVRAIPGTAGEVVATAAPTADDLVATGRARSLPRSIWVEVSTGGETGWVHAAFISYLGGTDDATADYRATDRRQVARTMRRLGRAVARSYATGNAPEARPDIVMVVAPSHGDLSEVTYDVVGFADDSVRGVRLHVFARKRPNRPGFRLRTIERTLLCDRGVSGEICV